MGCYGDFCNNICSSICVFGICEKLSGNCVGLCVLKYYGDKCIFECSIFCVISCNRIMVYCIGDCIFGYYGNFCEMDCSFGCIG